MILVSLSLAALHCHAHFLHSAWKLPSFRVSLRSTSSHCLKTLQKYSHTNSGQIGYSYFSTWYVSTVFWMGLNVPRMCSNWCINCAWTVQLGTTLRYWKEGSNRNAISLGALIDVHGSSHKGSHQSNGRLRSQSIKDLFSLPSFHWELERGTDDRMRGRKREKRWFRVLSFFSSSSSKFPPARSTVEWELKGKS